MDLEHLNLKYIKHKLEHSSQRVITTIKWIIMAVILGVLLGFVGAWFHEAISLVTEFRLSHPWVLLFLPVGALLISVCYKLLHDEHDTGTNLVLSAIHSNDELPVRMAPLIFVATTISHLVGASVGREGAALQLGGSLGNLLGRGFKFNDKDKHIMIMCGMSAAFSSMFGTPMAATVFSMEVISVGIMHYTALVPCAIAAFLARGIAARLGAEAPFYTIVNMPSFDLRSGVLICLLAVLAGLVSILFCVILRQTEHLYEKLFKNKYLRNFVGGLVILILTFLVGDQTYNGAGTSIIEACMADGTTYYAFLIKIIFTALSIAAGYKGGEIVPSFFIGASFGYAFGSIIGFAPNLCAAVGMGAVFCGVTNCPISSLLICLEMFGMEGMPFYLLAIAFSYMVSGYYGLYSSQKIVYSKYKSNYINKKTE